jgi:sugar phosphate isomerase/epimerase
MRAVAIHASCAGLLDLADPHPRHRNAAIDHVMTAVDVLAALHGRVIVIQATGSPRAVPDLAARLEHACASVRILQSACAASVMTLAIESPPRHLIGGSPDEFARLLAAAGPEARVCLDIGHITLEDWEAFAGVATGRLAHVHAPDTDGTFDDSWVAGHGRIDWSRVARTLDRMKYDEWLMLELGSPSEPLAQGFHRSAQHLRDRLDLACGKSRPPTGVASFPAR